MHQSWRHFIRTWTQHTAMQVATLAVLAGTFTVISFSLLVYENLHSILSRWGESVQLAVYLEDELPQEEVGKIKNFISHLGEFETVEYISKEVAAQRFRKQMASYTPDMLLSEQYGNPLPASFELKLKQKMKDEDSYQQIVGYAKKLKEVSGVEDVSYGQGWVENYAGLVDSFSYTSWILIVVLLSGSLFVIGNSIRHSISQRRDEIAVLELIGATYARIATPYIFEGAVMGLLASLGSLGLTYLTYLWQSAVFTQDLGFLGLQGAFGFIGWSLALAIVGLGTTFGALGSYLCVQRISTGWAAAQNG